MTRPVIILLAVAAAWMVTNAAIKAAHDYRVACDIGAVCEMPLE
jgi:hypothetical protein